MGITTHGQGGKNTQSGRTRTYTCWANMMARCYNPKSSYFRIYGAKGVSVCKRWRSFKNFYADMGDHPGKGYSLDRIDSRLNYKPGNCRWATAKEQSRNTSRNIYVTHNGETLTLSAWAERLGINYWTMHDRYRRGKRGAALLVPLDTGKSNARTHQV